ncbi:MAG: molybdopterin converting factor subunit 1 [Pseudomonadales bacterium]
MTVKIVFFASLREALGVDSVDLQISGSSSVSALILQLADQHSPEWLEILTAENIRIAVNQDMINEDVGVIDGDEVAFFPPVTGG